MWSPKKFRQVAIILSLEEAPSRPPMKPKEAFWSVTANAKLNRPPLGGAARLA